MKLKHRLAGGIVFFILLLISDIVLLTGSDLTQTWVVVVFITAFMFGFLVYIRSIRKEISRIKKEKKKHK